MEPNRDRLDEIIREFWAKAGPGNYLDARGLSEACFRHGVEEARKTVSLPVQPAPATVVYPPQHECKRHGSSSCSCERRKGERRAGTEILHSFGGEQYVAWTRNSSFVELRPNRRKPPDRRKA